MIHCRQGPSTARAIAMLPIATASIGMSRLCSADASIATRLAAAAILCASSVMLSIAAWLTPDPRGFGTHEQLGAPPCLTVMLWGVPCPTCGMCTAFAHAVRGELVSAFLAQPAGLALAALTVIAGLLSVFVLITGRRLAVTVPYGWKLGIAASALMVFVGAWGYKVLIMEAAPHSSATVLAIHVWGI